MHAVWVFCWQEREDKEGPITKVMMLHLVGTNMGVLWRMSFSQGNTREKV